MKKDAKEKKDNRNNKAILTPVMIVKLFVAASRWLSRHADILNDLNVYPVPDGDTGTNISMTLQSVENELMKLSQSPKMDELVEIVSESVLLGARGNSGTILSQIVQSFMETIGEYDEVDMKAISKALVSGKERAYNSVQNPVEGTILTVIRKISDAAINYKGPEDDFMPYLKYLREVAEAAVEETPNELDKLKQAGVVDAGGKGLAYILEGFEKAYLDPNMIEDLERIATSQSTRKEKMDIIHDADIEFKYCTEFIIESGDFELNEYKDKLIPLGDSMVCAQTKKKTKTHIHTNNPGNILEIAVAYGPLNNIKIENMEIQNQNLNKHHHVELQEEENFIINMENATPMAYFAIADNMKIGEMFIKDGATAVLIGGQTQNPSVEDIENVLNKIKSKNIVLLPNNKNIISTAKICSERSEKNIIVVDTKTMLEGHYILKNKTELLNDLIKQTKLNYSVEITKSSRDTNVDDIEIKTGDYISLVNGKITHAALTQEEVIKEVYSDLINKETLHIFTLLGEDATKKSIETARNVNGIRYDEETGDQEHYSHYIYIEQRDPNLPKIAIVTDSAADMDSSMLRDSNITVVPIKLKIGEITYRDGVDITKKEFWKKLTTEELLPKTSQPSPSEFKSVYENLFKKGYEKILSIHISNKLSGTHQAAKVARDLLPRTNDIILYDSGFATCAQAYQVLKAAKLVASGKGIENIIDTLNELKKKIKLYFVVNDLIFLQKGGRIGKAASKIGGLFNLKPILTIEDGEVSLKGKAFGENGALSFMEKIIRSEVKNMSSIYYSIVGGGFAERQNADRLKRTALTFSKVDYRGKYEVGSAIGVHTGPVYGFCLIPKIR